MESEAPNPTDSPLPYERWWVLACLVAALLFRLPGLDDPWSGIGFNSAIGTFTTAETVENLDVHGFAETYGMPYRYRIEMEDGTRAYEWYAHHPVFFIWVSYLSTRVLGMTELAIRMPWLVLSMLLPVAAWLASRRLFGRWVAMGTLVALVAMPLAAHYSLLPWVDNGILTACLCLVVERFVHWLETEKRSALAGACAWMLAASLLDWTAAFVTPVLGILTLLKVRHVERRIAFLASALLLPAMLGVSLALHALHMTLAFGWDQLMHDFTSTWSRTTTNQVAWGHFTWVQAKSWTVNLGWPVLAAMLVGVFELVRRRRGGGLLPWRIAACVALLVPGALYIYAFPFRGANHHFMWSASLGGFAALAGFGLASLRRVPWAMLLASVTVVAFGGWKTLELARNTKSDVVKLASQHPKIAPWLDHPDGVIVTSMGAAWALMPYSRTPIVPRVEEVAELEKFRTDVLSKLGPDRPVAFFFDVRLHKVQPELLSYLVSTGAPSIEVLDGLKASPSVAFRIFDLTNWAAE